MQEFSESEDLWKVTEIEEADYGCEECGPDGPKALVFLENGSGETRQQEIPEKILAAKGIQEGSVLRFGEDGELL